ncbi:MAG: hypothetical protein AMS26_15235 [Bacteroides sp. SM23_62]|nr:MAG: hypothetical protein AMS26_15235 [Bacteroides sp. SM23_62]
MNRNYQAHREEVVQISEALQSERNMAGKSVKQEGDGGEKDPDEKPINRITDNFIVRLVHNHPESE